MPATPTGAAEQPTAWRLELTGKSPGLRRRFRRGGRIQTESRVDSRVDGSPVTRGDSMESGKGRLFCLYFNRHVMSRALFFRK